MKSSLSRSLKIAMISTMATVFLSGCGNQIPDMTKEEAIQVGEFAAVTLLKYDANKRSRLVEEEVVLAYEQKQQELKAIADKMASESEPEGEGMKPVADTPTIEKDENVAVQNTVSSLEASLSVPEGIAITYTGYKISDAYPDDGSANGYLALDATAGKKLLVLEFAVQNNSSADATVDFFSTTSSFSVDMGNGAKENAMTTMLMNDMSTYIGTIPTGGSQNLVLLFEVEQSVAESMTGVQLYYKNSSGTALIQL